MALAAAAILFTFSCNQHRAEPEPAPACGTSAIVRVTQYTTMLELPSGERVQPIGRMWAGVAVSNGQALRIDYVMPPQPATPPTRIELTCLETRPPRCGNGN